MASTAAPRRRSRSSAAAAALPAAHPAGGRRHLAWLLGGMTVAFLVPFVLADRLGLERDIYLLVYVAAVVGLFIGWARDTGQSLREMVSRRRRLAVGLGVVFAGVGAVIATAAEGSSPHPGGIEFVGALVWRGIVYGAADGLLLSAFPILLVFAALDDSRSRRRAGGLVGVGVIAMVASLAMTAAYHAGYSDFRGSKLRKPVAGDLVWSAPTLATLNPVGAPIAHIGLHIGAVVHNYDTELFLPPHAALPAPVAGGADRSDAATAGGPVRRRPHAAAPGRLQAPGSVQAGRAARADGHRHVSGHARRAIPTRPVAGAVIRPPSRGGPSCCSGTWGPTTSGPAAIPAGNGSGPTSAAGSST